MADNQTLPRDPDVVVYSGFKGLRNDIAPERFGPEDLVVGNNVDIDKSGRLARRAGYTQQITGAAHSLWSDPQQSVCMFVQGGQLCQLNPNMSVTPLRSLVAALSPMSYEKVNDRVYFSNGVDNGVFEGGAVRSWGLPVPVSPGVSVSVGSMPAGTYMATISYLRNDGQESGAPLAISVTVPDGSGLEFTLPPAPDPSVVGTIIYLSEPNGETLFEAMTVAATQSGAAYTGDTTELGRPLDTQFLRAPPAGQRIAFYRGSMFVAVGDQLYASEPFAYELFDLRRSIAVDGRIGMLSSILDREFFEDRPRESGFFIGTDRSTGALIGSDPTNFQYVPKVDYGVIPGAVDYVDGSLFYDDAQGARLLPMWLSQQGICVGLPSLMIRNLTRTKYSFTAGGQGAALFMPGPNRFLATFNL